MGRNGVFGQLSGIDAFGKTMDDVRIRTNVGAIITLISFSLIAILTLGEFVQYRKIHTESTLVVDKSRGEQLTISLNMTFPRVPCYLISVDIMDISGDHQTDIRHEVERTRIDQKGRPIDVGSKSLRGEANRLANTHGKDYCGSCYGGEPPESGCCNTCDEVREAYVRRGWSFSDPDHIDQCVSEGWSQKIKEQNTEGCNVAGKVHVNKVIGNFHISPGRAFQRNSIHVHDLVPYLAGEGAEHHHFGHVIHELSFGSSDEYEVTGRHYGQAVKTIMGIIDPLHGYVAHTDKSQYMFQYFVKVVPTELHLLNGHSFKSHEYSVTSYERDLSPNAPNAANQATQGGGPMHSVQHGFGGMPGFFLNYDISALKAINKQTRTSFSHFLTSTCAIVGGILTVAGIVDAAVHEGRIRLAANNGDAGGWGAGPRMGGKLV
ncbi:DUF1692-domain-containing protein [Acaromyces ingoldii]|uniref:DUF1692-domain-containing protein n=1 Tax=Acaromyces ingoldii TaxID=215250 RepID=A0A316YFF4_9BASI|nr:DUF1692-domain-containing protein [Acaromyces ingoldii]PWN88280.1 DUF1692-domain-containing protein [Acaromyces ingoldii]